MQSFWHPLEPLPLALWDGADRTFYFFLILAQHCLFFFLLIGSSSMGIRRTSIGSETFMFFFFLICHETKIYITNSLNRALSPRIWALYCSAEYCPSRRMQKAHPFLTWSPKPASRARRLKLWYPVHAGLNPQVFFTFLKLLKSNK